MNNQKGFTNIALVLIIVAIAAVGGYFILTKKSGPDDRQATSTTTQTSTPTATPKNEIANWQTYADNEYRFEIKYPSVWFQSVHGPNLVLSAKDLNKGDVPTISISSLEQYGKPKLEDIYNGNIEKKIDFKKDCKSTYFAGTSAYDCPTGSYLGKHAIFFYNNNVPFVIHDNIDTDTSHKIISTFKFIK